MKRWQDNVAGGILVTASIWLRRLVFIHKDFGKTPKDLAKMTSREATNFMLDVVSAMEKNGKRGGYISGVLKLFKSWLVWNEIPVQQKISSIQGRYTERTAKR